jgi:hypothetical protein
MTLDELSIGDRVWHKHLHQEIEIHAIHPSNDPDREFVQCRPVGFAGDWMKTHPSMLSLEKKPPRKRKATANGTS